MKRTSRRSEATSERTRLAEDAAGTHDWRLWGPYLPERQWATVREDYSAGGDCWDHFSHDHARSRAYRWGEDGLLGLCDSGGRLCFALALWNERDAILKERLFGLTGPEGNHGEDVKEQYFALDGTPTHSWQQALYKYPQAAFPYARLVEGNRRRGKHDPELELLDTGVFDGDRYFDVALETAKASPRDTAIRVTITNRGPDAAPLHVLPTLWLRNTWSWGRSGEPYPPRGEIAQAGAGELAADVPGLGHYRLLCEGAPAWLFTENETNRERLFGAPNAARFVKDAFHERVVHGREDAVSAEPRGTKAAAWLRFDVPAGASVTLRLRLVAEEERAPADLGDDFDAVLAARRAEADAFYAERVPASLSAEQRRVARAAYAALLSTKRFYAYDVAEWLEGDPAGPPPPPERRAGRNAEWAHFNAAEVISVCDAWEYPWFAAWDLGFHMVAMARIDPEFAKAQLLLMLREWTMHPNGQLPAYEFAYGDVNAPVHAWACWRVYKISGPRGKRDTVFLARAFQKLLLNFTWWVNRKDPEGRNLFGGGFLGLDNIGVFDRSQPLPTGGHLEQADGTAWMAFYCATMLSMALELAREHPAYEDMATKFFEHFVAITDSINTLGGTGLWDEADGFYYDQLHAGDQQIPLRVRSMVGLLPLIAVEVLEADTLAALPDFRRRMDWFLANRPSQARHIVSDGAQHGRSLLCIASRERLARVLRTVLDEAEFLSPHGLRALSRVHREQPYRFRVGEQEFRVDYDPAESTSGLFGGNSNWRGPVWLPVNYLLIEALQRYGHFYGDALQVECPTGSGRTTDLAGAARMLAERLVGLFLPDAAGRRPCHGDEPRFAGDPHWRDLLVFPEYFHGDDGRGVGARFQGWTTLVVRCLEDLA
ncbi:MAG: glucosidase [Proteobacteria bacterium]|nr:MAG: glucosidase [Pseudomonadota bacterium]